MEDFSALFFNKIMKKRFCFFNERLPFYADIDELYELLKNKKSLLENYVDIASDLDDETYISRGTGFCTTKWAPDVIENKIEELSKQIEEIESWIKNF